MTDNQNLFGRELKKLRKDMKLTQARLATLAGISAAYISQLETGVKKPTDKVIGKLSGAFDIPENRLLIKVGKMKMDLAGTLTTRRREIPAMLKSLDDDQLGELLTYLAYIKVKATIKD